MNSSTTACKLKETVVGVASRFVMRAKLLSILLLVSLVTTASADALQLGRYYTDGMVLQRDKMNVIRGKAAPGAEVTVSFAGQEKSATTTADGNWAVLLAPMAASSDGAALRCSVSANATPDTQVSGVREQVVLDNVVVGDVIFFGRQTSVDISLDRDEDGRKIASALKPQSGYRSIVIHTVPATTPQFDLAEEATTGWQVVDQAQALTMSAAAFMLGRDLADKVDVPVGIVDVNLGWYFPVAWHDSEMLDTIGVYGGWRALEDQYESFINKTPYGRKEKHQRMITENPLEHPCYPSAGYNGLLHPLRGIAVKGMLAQIGNDYPYMYYEKLRAEGNMTDREALNEAYVQTYFIRKEGFRREERLMEPLADAWRRVFGDPSVPFAFIMPPASDMEPYAMHNREMRELQRKISEKEPGVGIILPGMEGVSFSGQPRDEALLAARSLAWVDATLYGNGIGTGPLFDRFEGEGTDVTVHFKAGTAKGLTAKAGALDTFEVADVDAEYVPAKAVIEGETIRLTTDAINRIFHVRYNWKIKPDQGLVNAAGLPAIPFRSEDAEYWWFFRYEDNDLAAEYSTPANAWKSGPVTLINAQMERVGYAHFSGWLGPVGIHTGPFGPNMGVREVKEGSPAYGLLRVGDVIYSANGKMLGEEEEMTMSAAITESEATDGKLVLGVHRDGENMDITVKLKVMGRYSSTSPWNCLKSERIVKNLEDYLVQNGAPEGFLSTDAMFLLGAGSPEHQWLVRRTANGLGVNAGNNWSLGYAVQYLAEYYLATGDKRVLPKIKKGVDLIAEMQIREDNKRNGGWYGRSNQPRNYPAMIHTGLSCMLGLTLARECGVDVDKETFERGLAYLERAGAPVGQIIYGDVFRSNPEPIDPATMLAGKLSTQNGKIAEAAILYKLLGDERSSYINSHISTHSWYQTYGGHGGHFWDVYWTPLGAAAHSKDAYIYFMKNHRWVRECDRMFDGSFITGGRSVASSGLALVVPRQRLRILGAAKSPFSPDAPDLLKPALEAYWSRDYAKAEMLALALLDDTALRGRDEPTVKKLAEEARRMQESIKSDVAAIQALSQEGRLYEAGLIMRQLKPIAAASDPLVAEATKAIAEGTARPDDKEQYEAAVNAGASEDDKAESKAGSAAALQKIRDEKAAAAAAAAAAQRTWECLTPKEFIQRKKRQKPDDIARLPEEATKWRYTVLETRDNAPDGWMQPGFDDSGWFESTLPISWHLNHIALLRTNFTVKDRETYDLLKFISWVFRQQDVAIYLNGTLIGRINNIEHKTSTIENAFKEAAMASLKNGENTLAIATRHNWRWGMMKTSVYNEGFDFMLLGRLAEEDDSEKSD